MSDTIQNIQMITSTITQDYNGGEVSGGLWELWRRRNQAYDWIIFPNLPPIAKIEEAVHCDRLWRHILEWSFGREIIQALWPCIHLPSLSFPGEARGCSRRVSQHLRSHRTYARFAKKIPLGLPLLCSLLPCLCSTLRTWARSSPLG